MPDPTNAKKASSIVKDIAIERPDLKLDLFDEDDEDDSVEDVNAEGDFTNDPNDAAE